MLGPTDDGRDLERRVVYSGPIARSVLSRVNRGDKEILDVGCGDGGLAKSIKESFPGTVVDGLSYNDEELDRAAPHLRKGYLYDLNGADPPALQSCYDLIVLSHVIEHTYWPKRTIERFVPLLKDGGRLIVTVPNVLYWRCRARLLFGTFEYEAIGVFDNTHFRFFTYDSLPRTVDVEGLEISEVWGDGHLPMGFLRKRLRRSLTAAVDEYVTKMFPGLFSVQIGVVAVRHMEPAL